MLLSGTRSSRPDNSDATDLHQHHRLHQAGGNTPRCDCWTDNLCQCRKAPPRRSHVMGKPETPEATIPAILPDTTGVAPETIEGRQRVAACRIEEAWLRGGHVDGVCAHVSWREGAREAAVGDP
eukprot:CAMPEP_0115522062 /NCGR_PEP_ID=MMETSP0271-20121206/79879_1 /TAXON_ID=71861 /ORGANISM="Scrippsiella trochoidea, Strain CCMP3099" /LENGTH=123 /DNA_ID=CAMNT_0002953335 /DNA_START=881 /DNA_END=1250 /DNA_ORIENTATION=-